MDLALRRHVLAFLLFPGLLSLSLTACSDGYSPNTYAATAAQQQAAVERGVIIGVRQVLISPDGTIGAASGGAAGGVAGAQLPGSNLATAFGAIGGTLVGGISGAAAQKAIGDTKAWEYIVQESGDKLVSITQTSKTALPIGQHVLVIASSEQARIVPDYTIQVAAMGNPAKTIAPSNGAAATEVNLIPLLPDADAADFQDVPATIPGDPIIPLPAAPVANPAATSPSESGPAAPPATLGSSSSATTTPVAKSAPPPGQVEPAASGSISAQKSAAAVTP
jgi:outer membrane lipoprotein SlyB